MFSSARVVPCACTGWLALSWTSFWKRVVNLLRHQAAFLDPALLSGVGAHAQKTPLLLQHFYAVAVVHSSDLVVHGGDAVAQAGLRRRHIHILVLNKCGTFAG